MANLADRFVQFLAASKAGHIMRATRVPGPYVDDAWTHCPVKIEPAPVFWFPTDIHYPSILRGTSRFTAEQATQMRDEVQSLLDLKALPLPYPECFFGFSFRHAQARFTVIARCREQPNDMFTVEQFHQRDDDPRFARSLVAYTSVMAEFTARTGRYVKLYPIPDEVFDFERHEMESTSFTVVHALCLLARQHEVVISDIDPPTNRYLARTVSRKPLQRMVEVDLSSFQYRPRYDPKEHPTGREQTPHDRRAHIRHLGDGRVTKVRAAKINGGAEALRHYAVKDQQANMRPS